MFGIQHLFALIFFAISGMALISWAQKLSEKKQVKIGNLIAVFLSAVIIVWSILKIYLRGFDIQKDLPFHLCNFIALLLPLFSFSRKKIYYDVLLFWVLAGTTHSIITPDLINGFPNYIFLKYWIVHAGLIIYVFYATLIYKFYPTLKSVRNSMIALQGYLIIVLVVNTLTGANYFYTNRKPEVGSALDYLGDWPTYIFVVELILIPYFLLIYLPFYLVRKRVEIE